MNILMMTNTYHPIVGGLENSIEIFSNELRRRGHRVLVVAPEYKDAVPETDVFRVPAIKNINNTGFSFELPVPSDLNDEIEAFKPDVVHAHHPFLVGDTAMRIASEYKIPIVFTHHTLYEKNIHYVPGKAKNMKRFVIRLAQGYANLCDHVVAPSESVKEMLERRGVKTPIQVIPTGIYVEKFKKGEGAAFRKFFGIPSKAYVVGIVGRVAEEKNIDFLKVCMSAFMKKVKPCYFVVVGDGPSLDDVKDYFREHKLSKRLICTGVLKGPQLTHAYHGLDVFAFASHSETQGLVLAEAMAAGTPVIAVNAPGVRDIVKDTVNGRMISKDDKVEFVQALTWMYNATPQKKGAMARAARKTAQEFTVEKSVAKIEDLYARVIASEIAEKPLNDDNMWSKTMRMVKTQAELFVNLSKATGAAFKA